MNKFFPNIPVIQYEGPNTKNPLAFRHYNADEVIMGKSMKEHLKFAAPYWHVMRNELGDPFGVGTAVMPWDDKSNSLENAMGRIPVFFEFLTKIGIDLYCWHDRDISPEGNTLSETHDNMLAVCDVLEQQQKEHNINLLWGTACLFINPRYSQGAATSPNADVFAYAASQVKIALEQTHRLGGTGYTFWGGREGYSTLLNTNMKRELDHLAAFLHLSAEHAKKIGFKGQLYIEPKPREPSTHQYDSDAAACLNFLREYNLLDHFKLNLETNHATLANHTMAHEMDVALGANALGSIDANQGDPLLGWDTDQFPTDIYMATDVMVRILKMGGFTTGGLNFDAKRRRESHEPEDLFHAHIGGMDTFARALKIAAKIIEDGAFDDFISTRYASFDTGAGATVENGTASLDSLHDYALGIKAPVISSGRQEMLENLRNDYIR